MPSWRACCQRRSENWKTLRDYVLNEKEHFDLLGPGRARLFGTNREFTWYLRDGVLVRSPVRFEGVSIGAEESKKYEDDWRHQEDQREVNRRVRAERRAAKAEAEGREDAGDLTALARDGAEPRFISESYFMNFHFEPGNYFLAGRETLEGRNVLRSSITPPICSTSTASAAIVRPRNLTTPRNPTKINRWRRRSGASSTKSRW